MATIEKCETKSGATLYRVRYRTPDNRQTDKRGFKTKRDAQDFASTVEVAKLRGEYVAASIGRTTVGELGPAWLDRQRGHEAERLPLLRVGLADTRRTAVGECATHRYPFQRRAGVGFRTGGPSRPVDRSHRLRCAGPHPRRLRPGSDAGGQSGPRGETAPGRRGDTST